MIMPVFYVALLNGSSVLSYLGIASLGVIGAIVVWWIIKNYIKPTSPEERKNTLEVFFKVLGGTVVLLGVYFTWQELRTSREALLTTQEGQITERFTRAIDQLGKADQETSNDKQGKDGQVKKENNLAIRLGGIYALERIGKNSKTDYWTVMEVLTAYIRQNSPWRTEMESVQMPIFDLQADTQAILTAIGRRELKYQAGESQRLNLAGVNIRWASLNNANLDGADLKSSHLEYAYLNGAHMKGALLFDAHFREAFLEGADLEGADLRAANMVRTHAKGVILNGADLTGADLTEADLTGADLRGAKGLTQQQLDSAITNAKTLTNLKVK